jgi:hypothetical protein
LWRTVAVSLGLAGLGSGGAAVYITHLEAGPVGLLVVGLILILVGMSGRMPSRIRIGDNEAVWEAEREAMREFVKEVADRTPEEQQPELLGALSNLAQAAPEVASAGLLAVAYEQLVVSMIYDAFLDLGEVGSVSGSRSPDLGADMQVETADRLLFVEARSYPGRIAASTLDRLAGRVVRISDQTDKPISSLLVTRTPLTHLAREALQRYADLYVAVIAGPQDREKLLTALRNALGLEDSGRYFE